MLEALFVAVAQVVLDKAVDFFEVSDRLRQWLGRDPAKLALRKALARAYAAFARQYPDLTASLFTEPFLTQEATPELVKLLQRDGHPDPTAFATLWVATERHPIRNPLLLADGKPAPLAVQASSDFLRWLEAELKAEPVFQSLFDSRALDGMQANVAELTEAQKDAQKYEYCITSGGAVVTGTVSAGGDFIGRDYNVTHTYNTYFGGDFAALDDFYIRPDAVFQRVRVEDFIGRDWLAARVDDFLNDPNRKSGAFVLIGEAGVGKTSFLAHLANTRRYLHLFAEQVPGETNLPRALQSLAAQLIARYRIEPYAKRDAMPQLLSTYSDFLHRILWLAAKTLAEGEQIVIVCDALDEAGAVPGGNVLGLPAVLPDGVYLILSQRPVNVPLNFKVPPIPFTLDAAGPDNQADVRTYLTAIAERPTVSQQLRANGYSPAQFVQTLAEKSNGVWMYLYYVVSDIEAGNFAPLKLDQLPAGLVGYYSQYWDDWRMGRNGRGGGPAHWDDLYAPLLGMLAAAQEPLTLEQFITWAGVSARPSEVKRLLTGQWRAFISKQAGAASAHSAPAPARYKLYHLSLRDFITGQSASAQLLPQQISLMEELKEQTLAAHRRIVEGYRARCGGAWPALVKDDYARLYLTAHLHAVDAEEMFRLVALDDSWAKARDGVEESYAGYLADLELAWRYAERDDGWDLGHQVRCALIKSSIHALASNLPPELPALAVETGLWSAAKAVAVVRQMSNEWRQVEGLVALLKLSPLHELPSPLKVEVLAAACEIKDEFARAIALSDFAPYLTESLIARALTAVREIKDESSRERALSDMTQHLPEALYAEVLAVVREITNESIRAKALRSLGTHLPEALKLDALTLARGITDESSRSKALADLAPHLPESLKVEVAREALIVARGVKGNFIYVNTLSALARHLPNALRVKAIKEAFMATCETQDESHRAIALSNLAPHLPKMLKVKALGIAREITDESDRARALTNLAMHLPKSLKVEVLKEALASARKIRHESNRARALSDLALHLPESLQVEVLREALASVQNTRDTLARASAFSNLVSRLPNALWFEALEVAREFKDEHDGWRSLSSLALYLPDSLKAEALAVMSEIRDQHSRASALRSFASHLPESLKTEALAAARAITNESDRASALNGIALHLPESLKVEVAKEALAGTREITDEPNRIEAFDNLISYLPESLKVEMLAAAREFKGEAYRATALSNLVPHLPDSHKAEALAVAREFKDESFRAWVLKDLAPHLPESLKFEALTMAREITNESSRMQTLRDLAIHLPDVLKAEAMREALAVARKIGNESDRVKALVNLALHLPKPSKDQVIQEALEVAYMIGNDSKRAKALGYLTPHLPELSRDEVIQKTLTAVRVITDEFGRAHILADLARRFPQPFRFHVTQEALTAARAIKVEVEHAWVLKRLAPHLQSFE